MKAIKSIILFGAVLLSGCWWIDWSPPDDPEPATYPGTIQRYSKFYVPQADSNKKYYKESVISSKNEAGFTTLTDGDSDITAEQYINGSQQEKDRYLELCYKFGDYCEEGIPTKTDVSFYWANSDIVNKIVVTSKQDWDAEHPAGTDLGDCFDLSYDTFMPYVENGHNGRPKSTRIRKRLSEINEPYKLVRPYWMFIPIVTPTKKSTYSIDVRYILEDGREINYPVKFTFK